MKPFFLIGFMGSGKSTIGESLARTFSYSYKDTDHMIEKNQACTIAEIFADEGEAAFRDYETMALKQSVDAGFISTGGGIIERLENRQFMNEHGIVIYLQASFSDIADRLQQDPTRPLWHQNDIQEKKQLFEKRLPTYEACADYIVNTNNLTVEEIVQAIKKIIDIHKTEE